MVSVTTTEAAGNDSTEQGMDTVEIPRTICETGNLCCSEMTENSTAVGNPINLMSIRLDTVAISPVTVETGIEGCMDAAENLPAADNSLERVLAAEYSAENSATSSSSVSVPDADDGKEPSEDETATPNASTMDSGGNDEGESNIFATSVDMPPQSFVHVDKFTSELVDLRAELAIGALSEQITACFTKNNANTEAIDNRMQTKFVAVNKTVTANYERLEKRLVIVERDMDTRIAAHNNLEANLTEAASKLHAEQALLTKNVHTSAQRLISFKTENSK